MCPSDYNRASPQEISIPIEEAGRHALKMVVPFLVLYSVPFFLIHGWAPLCQITLTGAGLFFLCSMGGIVVHELLHALFFSLLSSGSFKSIRFGIDRKTWSPYCHPKSAMKVWAYRTGAMAPLCLLGILPSVFSLLNGNLGFLVFGWVFSIATGGDLVSVWLTRGLSVNDLIKDHASKIGFYIVEQS